MEEVMGMMVVIPTIFIGLPWLIFHYITKWKTAATLTREDEGLLDELHDLARRLDDRVRTVERIMDAESPGWRTSSIAAADVRPALEPRLQETRR